MTNSLGIPSSPKYQPVNKNKILICVRSLTRWWNAFRLKHTNCSFYRLLTGEQTLTIFVFPHFYAKSTCIQRRQFMINLPLGPVKFNPTMVGLFGTITNPLYLLTNKTFIIF